MKKLKLLFLLPVLALSSCGMGQEVSTNFADKYASRAVEKAPEIKAYEYIYSLKSTSGKSGDRSITSGELRMLVNENDDLYFSMSAAVDEEKETIEFYYVANEQFGHVIYMKANIDGEKVEAAYKEDDNEYSSILSSALSESRDAVSAQSEFSPDKIEDYVEASKEASNSTSLSIKYYSKNEANLSIVVTTKSFSYVGSDTEFITNSETKITYDNYLLKEVSASAKSNFGNRTSLRLKVNYAESYKISLPKGWEGKLAAE